MFTCFFTECYSYYVSEMAVLNTVFVFYESSTKNQCFTFSFLISFFSLSYFGVLLYFCTGIGKKISKMNRRTMKVGSMMALNVSLLVMVFSMGVLAPAIAQNKQNRKPRKKLKELPIGDVCSNGATLFSWQNWVKVK